ncbi:MAG: biotin/lipoyl-binding protein [Balneolaceae bacterium]|nr:biotin/lipoyl-binding protein [Balneolaceae bacterium]
MNKLTINILLVFFLAGLITACSEEQQAAEQEELVKTVNVETTMIEPQLFQRYLRLVGTVESANDVRISSEVSGRIEEYFTEKGKRVQKGEPILKIDDEKLMQEKPAWKPRPSRPKSSMNA